MRYILAAILAATCAAQPVSVSAQQLATAAPAGKRTTKGPDRRVLNAVRLPAGLIQLDGRLDEDAWQVAGVASDFTEYEPTAGRPSSQRTEARILYDETVVYVAIRAFDTAPDSIISRLGRRDQLPLSDQVGVALDSYFDRRTAFVFMTNPTGSKADTQLYDDGMENDSWDPIWQVATSVDSLGWTAEFRIPLSQLRFSAPVAGTPQVWGVQFLRKIARSNETSYWAPMTREANGIVSYFGELHGIDALRPARNLEVLPYSVASLTRAPTPDGNDPFFHHNDSRASIGADFKYGLSSNLTVSGTLNPDFGQVESDPSVVNLSAFETFLPEKRPFFVEGADIFNFGIGIGDGDLGNESLFYSRRIGRAPQGSTPDEAEFSDAPNATTILGAAKLSGKTKHGWSLGVLDAVTARERADYITEDGLRRDAVIEPATNYAVARLTRDFNEGQTAFGSIFTATNRQLDGDLQFLRSAAYTGGVNARHRWKGGNYVLNAFLVGSHVRGDTAAINRTQRSPSRYFQRPDNDHTDYDPARTSLTGWAASLEAGKMGGGNWRYITILNAKAPGFEANDVGFVQNADQIFHVWFVGYQQNKPGRYLNSWRVNTNQWNGWTFGGDRVAFGGNVNGGFQLKNFWGFNGGLNHDLSTWSVTALRGGPAMRTPARSNLWTNFYSDSRKPVRAHLGFGGNVEHDTDGYNVWVEPSVSVRAGSRADISVGPSFSRRQGAWQYVARRAVAGTDQYILSAIDQTELAMTARLNYTFSPSLSLQLYAQPFVSAGDYSGFMRVKAPRARRFEDRVERFGADQIAYEAENERYVVDMDRDGTRDFTIGQPDFNVKELRSNAVLRWEYRPGSTLFLVWSQGRSAQADYGSFSFDRDVKDLFGAESTNVFLIKMNYWLGL